MSIFNIFKILPFIVFWAGNISAQEILSLDKCIELAIEKSLLVQGNQLTLKSTEIDLTQAFHARYPSLSASTNVGWNFGRTIDPTRNEFITKTFFNNGFNLSSNVVLFNGSRINNRIKQSEANNKASFKDLEQAQRDIALNVASLYLNILFAKENLQNAENQLKQTNEQLILLNKQILVGNRPENDRLDIESQLAVNEQSIVEAKNNLNINLLNIKQLMRLEPDKVIDIVAPREVIINTDPEVITFNEVFASALNNQPAMKANEMRIKSAELGRKIAAAELMPSLFGGVNLRTNYSNQGVSIAGYESKVIDQQVIFNGQTATVGFPQQVPILEKSPYFDQFSSNLSYGLGFTMSVPIYNNYIGQSGLQRAKLNVERAYLNHDQTKETLKITVGQALADAKAAKARFQATDKTKNAQTNVYNNALKRFEAGSTNVFELTRLKTQMETSTINHLIAKYEYIFRSKVLDFYLGKPIRFAE